MVSEREQLEQLLASHFWENDSTVGVGLPILNGISFHATSHRWKANWPDGSKSRSAKSFSSIKEAKADLRKRVEARLASLESTPTKIKKTKQKKKPN